MYKVEYYSRFLDLEKEINKYCKGGKYELVTTSWDGLSIIVIYKEVKK